MYVYVYMYKDAHMSFFKSNSRLNLTSPFSEWHKFTDKLLRSRVSATVKLMSPSRVWVCAANQVSTSAERRRSIVISGLSFQCEHWMVTYAVTILAIAYSTVRTAHYYASTLL